VALLDKHMHVRSLLATEHCTSWPRALILFHISDPWSFNSISIVCVFGWRFEDGNFDPTRANIAPG